MNPPPPSVDGIARMPMVHDGYLLWAVAEGGEKLKTAMPAFKDVISREQQWQVILYLVRGLPAGGPHPGPHAPHMRGGGMHRGGMPGGGMRGGRPRR